MYLHVFSSNNGFIMENICAEYTAGSEAKSKKEITRGTCSFYVSRRTRLEQTIEGEIAPDTTGRRDFQASCSEDKKNQKSRGVRLRFYLFGIETRKKRKKKRIERGENSGLGLMYCPDGSTITSLPPASKSMIESYLWDLYVFSILFSLYIF